jgi:integrase
VDFRREVITVKAGYANNGEARSVPMNDTLTMLLKSAKVNAAEGERVFCNRYGQPYRSFRTAFERAVYQAGIQDFTFHDLRHTFASRLVMAERDLPTVKELLGHKDITMTLRYAHLSSGHKQTAVRKLEQFAVKIPASFTTPHTAPTGNDAQVVGCDGLGR